MASEDEVYKGVPRSAPADFDGPTKERTCTDIIGTIMIFGMWIAMTAIGIYAMSNGNYEIVFNPMDYDGNVCGTNFNSSNMTDYPKLVYINSLGGGVCVKECPKVENLTDIYTLLTYNGVYQAENASLPTDYVEVANYSDSENALTCDTQLCPTDPELSYNSQGINEGIGFAYYAVDTFEVNKRCLTHPDALTRIDQLVNARDSNVLKIEAIDDASEFFSRLYGDVFAAMDYILLLGTLLSLILGLVYAQFLRIRSVLSTVIWTSILAATAVIFATGAYALTSANDWETEDPQEKSDRTIRWTKIFSYVIFGVGGIVLCLVIFLRKEIQLAVACTKEASRGIAAMPLLTFFPILQIIGLLGFLFIWFYYAVYLASMGEIITVPLPTTGISVNVRRYEYDAFITRSGWYFIFCLFWTVAFIAALGEIIIAMSISKWYFSRNKSSVGNSTFLESIGASAYYHIGTAAIGSLLVAIIRIIRAIVAKIQKKAAQMDNKFGEALLCCCQCCLWCFEKFIKFINKNAFIQTAIFGTAFCSSAREAFFLILRNAKRVASISFVSSIVLSVGKLFITLLTAGISYMVIDSQIGSEIHSAGGPTALIVVISYFVGDMFMDIYEMSIATILQCFIADEEMFDAHECYADEELRKWFDDYDEEEKKIIDAS